MTRRPPTISAVIPTRNRPEELKRLLASLRAQTLPLKEIIVVDAGDRFIADEIRGYADLPLRILRSLPSVCRQRNAGIRDADSDYVFLCDDDMEVPPDYIATIDKYIGDHPDHPIVTGMISERGPDGLFRDLPHISDRRLVWNFLFMLGIWCDLRDWHPAGLAGPLIRFVKRWFLRRGNTESPAGWPIVGSIHEPQFQTRFFGLGASVIRRTLLLSNPYDESLGESGIGDHYDLALRLAPHGPITVLTEIRCYHHRTDSGRLSAVDVYFQRILVLNRIGQNAATGKRRRKAFLLWSLCGNLIAFMFHGNREFVKSTLNAIEIIWRNEANIEGANAKEVSAPVQADVREIV